MPWALQRPVALIFDEYDAGRPDVMFVIQRMLERDGKFTLLDQNRVIQPHPYFRLFATTNTVGLGNLNGLYHGTQVLNHAQMDRWNIVATLNYLPRAEEAGIVLARVPELADDGRDARWSKRWSAWPSSRARASRRRPVDADVAAHGDHLGGELQIFRDPRWLSVSRSSTSATRPSGRSWPSISSAASTANWMRGIGEAIRSGESQLMSTERQARRRAEQREALCAAAVRALTGDAATALS